MSTIDKSLEIVANRFKKDSKRYLAARYIVKQGRKIPKNEKDAICQEIPIADSTLRDLFTELRKMGLYPPQETIEISEEPSYHPQESSQQVEETEYATIEDLDLFRKEMSNFSDSIRYLTSLMTGGAEIEVPPEEEQEFEPVMPDEMTIRDPSLNRQSIWLKPKTQMYYDLTRQGIFGNYSDTNEISPFNGFKGNLSDFFNTIVDDYFIRNFNADIGILMRRFIR